jgi:hypothetical protein
MEFVVPAEGPATLIEVNGRIASQFAPMMQAVHGRSTYDALLALACGTDPKWRPGRPDGVASSSPPRWWRSSLGPPHFARRNGRPNCRD